MNSHNTPKNKNSQSIEGEKGQIVLFWKTPGETLATMLRRFREEYNLSNEEKLTYAGRLDPMAEGIVPVLVGEARFQKDMLLGRSKTYEVAILLGVGTDSGDMLGLPRQNEVTAGLPTANPALSTAKGNDDITTALDMLRQTVSLPYPNYSSRPVDGKPLFMHARASNKVVLPIKKVTIYDLELLSIKEHEFSTLITDAIEIIEKVQGDFRQEEIIKHWEEIKKSHAEGRVQIVTIRTTVSSGTYMRSLAEKLGLLLKVPALAYSIKRTAVEGIK